MGLEAEQCYNITIQAGTAREFGAGRQVQYSTDNYVIPRLGTRPTVTPLGSDTLNVEWQAAVDGRGKIYGYAIEYTGMTGGAWQRLDRIVQHLSVKQRYYEKIQGLEANTEYQVRIRVLDQSQREGEPSDVAQGRTGCGKPSAPPTDIQLTAPSSNDVRVVWQAPAPNTWHCSGITYNLQYRNGTTSQWSLVELQGGATAQRFESTPYNRWTVRMQTVNIAGTSEWSDEVAIMTPEDAPTIVPKVTGEPTGPTSIKVSWEKPEQENGQLVGYTVIYRLKSNGACAIAPGAPVAKEVRYNQLDLSGLQPDSTYEVIVKARTSKEGPPSDPIFVTTFEERPTGSVSRLRAATVNPTSATFDWQPPECSERNGEITSYEYEIEPLDSWVERRTIKGMVNSERADVNDLVPWTRYNIRVRAGNSQGLGPFSEYVQFQTRPGAPPAPTSLKEEEARPTSILISFLPPMPPHGQIDEYKVRFRTTAQGGGVQWVEQRVRPDQLKCSTGDDRSGRLCYRVGGMQQDTDYTIEVSAHTAEGEYGQWTRPGLQSRTTEMDIPTLENPLKVIKQHPDAVDIEFEGLDPREHPNVAGYQFEITCDG
jgi:protein sidekick